MKPSSKKIILTAALALGIASIASTGTVFADEDKPTADASVGIYSKYVWRGYELSQDSVVIQPSLTVGYKGFAANLWGNLDTDQKGASDSFNWNETDFTLSYDGAYEKLGYSLGYIYYDLDGADDTQEIYAGLSYDILLSPTLTVYKDIDNYSGYYVNLGISHSFPLTDKYTLDLGASAGYYNRDDINYSALHDGQLSASITIPVNEYLSITPEIHYSFPLSDDADDVEGLDNVFYGGLSASFAF
jgi:uncharacterized protein (TIGR02001 family)